MTSNRSHPISLRNLVRKSLLSDCGIRSGDHLLIGVSGGSDSMALLHVLAGLRDDIGFRLSAVSVNHNLRPEAASEIQLVREFCLSLAVSFHERSVLLPEKGNTQANAREARYEAIRDVKDTIVRDSGYTQRVFIVVAHHAEDRAETILMKIIKGIPVDGLAVMPARFHNVDTDCVILRPMIRAQKRDVMLHIERRSIAYCEDPYNRNVDKYTRSKIRFNIMPILREMNPNITEALCKLSDSVK